MPVMQSLVRELDGPIHRGDYGMLIGDDISGRIPTLILRGVINHINGQNNRPMIPTVFVKGTDGHLHFSSEQGLTHVLQPFRDLPNGNRVLIVSEYMKEGYHVRSIGKVIHEAKLSYDIATLGKKHSTQRYKDYGILRDDEEIYPTSESNVKCHAIFGEHKLTGVLHDINHSYTIADRETPRDAMLAARRDVRIAIGQLLPVKKSEI